MTTTPPHLSCRFLESLWAAPATFSAIAPDGAVLAGDVGLGTRAAAILRAAGPEVCVVRDGDLIVVRHAVGGPATVGEVPGGVLPELLEADLRRVTSGAV